jgi:hypothetical protein
LYARDQGEIRAGEVFLIALVAPVIAVALLFVWVQKLLNVRIWRRK